MKKLIFLALVLGLGYYGYQTAGFGLFGLSKSGLGISDKDPLGMPEKLHAYFSKNGFEGELGTINSPRSMSYKSSGDFKKYPDFGGFLNIAVGKEEYVQKISAVFVGTKHGSSPQRAGPAEIFAYSLWKALGGDAQPKFKKISDGSWKIPWTVKFGRSIEISFSHMETTFTSGAIIGKWAYDDTGSPYELIELKLK